MCEHILQICWLFSHLLVHTEGEVYTGKCNTSCDNIPDFLQCISTELGTTESVDLLSVFCDMNTLTDCAYFIMVPKGHIVTIVSS